MPLFNSPLIAKGKNSRMHIVGRRFTAVFRTSQLAEVFARCMLLECARKKADPYYVNRPAPADYLRLISTLTNLEYQKHFFRTDKITHTNIETRCFSEMDLTAQHESIAGWSDKEEQVGIYTANNL